MVESRNVLRMPSPKAQSDSCFRMFIRTELALIQSEGTGRKSTLPGQVPRLPLFQDCPLELDDVIKRGDDWCSSTEALSAFNP